MQIVPFKGQNRPTDKKMLKVTLRFIRNVDARAGNQDDILHIYDDDEYHETCRIVFRPKDVKKGSEFYLDERRTMDYISSILKSMQHDSDPFEYIQVDTAMHPTILYHVSDMDNRDIRWSVEDAIYDAIRRPIRRV